MIQTALSKTSMYEWIFQTISYLKELICGSERARTMEERIKKKERKSSLPFYRLDGSRPKSMLLDGIGEDLALFKTDKD